MRRSWNAGLPAGDTVGMHVSGLRGSLEPTIDRKRQLYRKFADYYSRSFGFDRTSSSKFRRNRRHLRSSPQAHEASVETPGDIGYDDGLTTSLTTEQPQSERQQDISNTPLTRKLYTHAAGELSRNRIDWTFSVTARRISNFFFPFV